LFFLGFISYTTASDADDVDVLVLTKDNFDQHASSDLILIEFYAPWCGHCKSLAPEYAKAATILKANDPPVSLGKVDATVETGLATRFGVSGYPTLFVFRNGKETKYEGPRKAEGIVNYMKKQVGPAAKPLGTVEEAKKFIEKNEYAVVGFFSGGKQTQLHSAFLLVASKLRDHYVFAKVTNDDTAKEFGVTGEALVAFKEFDEKQVTYSGPTKTGDVQSWVEQHSLPLVGTLKDKNVEAYERRGLPVAKLFVNFDVEKNVKQAKYYLNRLKKAAEAFKGKILTAIANKADFTHPVQEYGFDKEEHGLVIEHQQKKFRLDDKFSAESTLKFFQDFIENKLRPFIKSEKIPKSNDGPVKTVVGYTFDEIVNDPEKDVLIEFYAPWCGHCKSLVPKYEELGKKLQSVPTVTIAKIDATANDWDRSRFEVSGYPTLFFVPGKENAQPVKYEGDREVDAMYKFVKSKAAHKFGKK